MMRGLLAANGVKDRKVVAADSFSGLPAPELQQDAGDIHHTFTELMVPESAVRANFEKYGLLDEQVVFVSGYFKHTLPQLDIAPFALVRLDGDMYESTSVALRALYPKVAPKGFVIIDDYGAVPACKRAVDDFRSLYEIEEALNEIDWTGVWWQKRIEPP